MTAIPHLDRISDKSDIEDIPFSSQTMIMKFPITCTSTTATGSESSTDIINIHHKMLLKPMTHIDGIIKVDLVEKTTFGSGLNNNGNQIIGSVEVPVSSIQLNETTKLTTSLLNIANELNNFDMKLNLQFDLSEYTQ